MLGDLAELSRTALQLVTREASWSDGTEAYLYEDPWILGFWQA